MASTEVLLVKPVDNLGAEGDRVKVRAGYARNWLFPRHLAVPLDQGNKRRLEALMKAREAREATELRNSEGIAEKLRQVKLALAVKTGAKGKMFGSVTGAHLLEKLEELGYHLDKRHLLPFSPIKELGRHTATIRLHDQVEAEIEFEIVSENPIEE